MKNLEPYAPYAICVLITGVFLIILLRRGGRKTTSTATWRSYLKGQGTLLFVFLSIGGLLASLSSYLGPEGGDTSKGGQLFEYHQLNPTERVIYEEQDVEAYHHITVLARTMAPQNSSAIVAIYGDPKGEGERKISQIEAVADSWSRWDQKKNSCKRITLKIADNGSLTGATQVDVLLYVFP